MTVPLLGVSDRGFRLGFHCLGQSKQGAASPECPVGVRAAQDVDPTVSTAICKKHLILAARRERPSEATPQKTRNVGNRPERATKRLTVQLGLRLRDERAPL